ncbi:hypothetical protein K2X33_07065 [bacterium]|nr:hypothetical protein [bacterium]
MKNHTGLFSLICLASIASAHGESLSFDAALSKLTPTVQSSSAVLITASLKLSNGTTVANPQCTWALGGASAALGNMPNAMDPASAQALGLVAGQPKTLAGSVSIQMLRALPFGGVVATCNAPGVAAPITLVVKYPDLALPDTQECRLIAGPRPNEDFYIQDPTTGRRGKLVYAPTAFSYQPIGWNPPLTTNESRTIELELDVPDIDGKQRYTLQETTPIMISPLQTTVFTLKVTRSTKLSSTVCRSEYRQVLNNPLQMLRGPGRGFGALPAWTPRSPSLTGSQELNSKVPAYLGAVTTNNYIYSFGGRYGDPNQNLFYRNFTRSPINTPYEPGRASFEDEKYSFVWTHLEQLDTANILKPRRNPLMAWTGNKVVIFSGVGAEDPTVYQLNGAVFNETTQTIVEMPPLTLPPLVDPIAKAEAGPGTASSWVLFSPDSKANSLNYALLYNSNANNWVKLHPTLTKFSGNFVWVAKKNGSQQSTKIVYLDKFSNASGIFDLATLQWTAFGAKANAQQSVVVGTPEQGQKVYYIDALGELRRLDPFRTGAPVVETLDKSGYWDLLGSNLSSGLAADFLRYSDTDPLKAYTNRLFAVGNMLVLLYIYPGRPPEVRMYDTVQARWDRTQGQALNSWLAYLDVAQTGVSFMELIPTNENLIFYMARKPVAYLSWEMTSATLVFNPKFKTWAMLPSSFNYRNVTDRMSTVILWDKPGRRLFQIGGRADIQGYEDTWGPVNRPTVNLWNFNRVEELFASYSHGIPGLRLLEY